MSRLYIMRGLPASGKSTKAEEILSNGNTVRINKDLLRTMLHFDKFTGKNEAITCDAATLLAKHFLDSGLNVIIDDTNLNPRTYLGWKEVGNQYAKSVDTIDMYTTVSECVIRDSKREKPVGRDVIVKMAMQHKNFLEGEKFVICDLDGTLANIEHRLHYAKGETKDWDKFFSGIPEDKLRSDVFEKLVDVCKEHDCRPIFVSARPERCRKDTEEWLQKNKANIHYLLLMRADKDTRDDSIVKKEMYDKYLKNLEIVKVFDDRPRVIRMWREECLEVEDCGDGVEF